MRVLAGFALVAMGAGALVLATGSRVETRVQARGDAPVGGGALDRTDIRSNNSPTLARNPARAGNVALTNRVDTPRYECVLQVSFDGGERWRRTLIPLPSGEEPKCFAPDVAFAPDGTLYVSFVTLEGRGNVPNAVWTARSADGGRTLSRPVRALGKLAFQVRLVADPTDSDRIYLSWLQGAQVGFLRFTRTGNPIQSMRSEDGGTTWEPPVRITSPDRARVIAPSPAIGARGELYVLYVDLGEDRLDYDGGHGGEGGPKYAGMYRLVLARSADRGRRWAEIVVDDRIVPIGRFVVFYPPFPALAVDRSGGRVYAGYHDARLGDADVWVWSLPPGGGSWEGPTRVNDTRERDGTSQYLPQLAVAPDGRLDAVYYDRRSDRGNVMNQVSLQSSVDSGKTFTGSVRLSSRAFDSRIGFGSRHGLPDLGSRLALLSGDRRSLAVWTDTRAGTQATNKQDLGRSVVAFSESASLPSAVRYLVGLAGLALVLAGLALTARVVAGGRV